jgi:hypothetical protein
MKSMETLITDGFQGAEGEHASKSTAIRGGQFICVQFEVFESSGKMAQCERLAIIGIIGIEGKPQSPDQLHPSTAQALDQE